MPTCETDRPPEYYNDLKMRRKTYRSKLITKASLMEV